MQLTTSLLIVLAFGTLVFSLILYWCIRQIIRLVRVVDELTSRPNQYNPMNKVNFYDLSARITRIEETMSEFSEIDFLITQRGMDKTHHIRFANMFKKKKDGKN